MSDKTAKDTVDLMLPKVEAFLKTFSEGKISDAIEGAIPALESGIWDKAVEHFGRLNSLPADLIARLTSIDDEFSALKGKFDGEVGALTELVEGFKARLSGIDLNRTITMSYLELQKHKMRTGIVAAIVFAFLGYFLGQVLPFI